MKGNISFIVIVISIILAGLVWFGLSARIKDSRLARDDTINNLSIMKISSLSFEAEGAIPAEFTCDGNNIAPTLVFYDVPSEAASLALALEDPDAPGGLWVHWLVWNTPPNIDSIPSKMIPRGASLGKTSFGHSGYGGPCPPSGQHRYFFRLFALDKRLDLPPDSGYDEFERALMGHVLAEAELMGTYKRTKPAR